MDPTDEQAAISEAADTATTNEDRRSGSPRRSRPKRGPKPPSFQVNDRVRHRDFGEGAILNIRKRRTIIDVIFDAAPRFLRSVPPEEIWPASMPAPEPAPVPEPPEPPSNNAVPAAPPEPATVAPAAAPRPAPASVAELQVGDKVRHPNLGQGSIQSISKNRCRVLFDNGLPPCEVRMAELRPA